MRRRPGASDGGIAWDHDHLAVCLENPRAAVEGTKMAFAGLPKPEENESLILLLETLE